MATKRDEKKKRRRPTSGPTLEDLSDHSTHVELTKDSPRRLKETEVDSMMDNVLGTIESAQEKVEKPKETMTDTK